MAPRSSRTGSTIAAVKLRAGPASEDPVLDVLKPNTPLTVLDQQGEWFYVKAADKEGYVHSKFVLLTDQNVFATTSAEEVIPAGLLSADGPVEAPEGEKLPVNPKASLLERLAADIWNRFGGLLADLAAERKIELGVAVAVLAVEAGGRGFGPDGRMLIRFENQIFFDRWGKDNRAEYDQHFRFNLEQRWMGHKWRPDPKGPWLPTDTADFHGSQDREWQGFSFARALDDTAAKLSISMGAPQIMGFNYLALNYDSVHKMFDAFSASERNQIIGFFNFVQGASPNSARMQALQQQDFNAFASHYNGPGQGAKYGSLMRGVFDNFHRLKAT